MILIKNQVLIIEQIKIARIKISEYLAPFLERANKINKSFIKIKITIFEFFFLNLFLKFFLFIII